MQIDEDMAQASQELKDLEKQKADFQAQFELCEEEALQNLAHKETIEKEKVASAK
jgi:hypothetical protein